MLFGKRWARVSRFLGVFGVVLVVALAARSQAITWGTIDTTHPNVGAILTQHADGTFGEFCSGTLVSARVFLTAGHCTDALVSRAFPVSRLRVSFARLDDKTAVALKGCTHVAALTVEDASKLTDRTLAIVGTFRELRELSLFKPAAAGAIQDAKFINVGYGDNQEFVVTGDRQISYSSFRNLHDAWLYMSQNIHHEDGGTCYGDSGGPTFFVDPSSHAEYIVATTSWGDGPCKATNNNYRVDISSSLDFIQAMIGQSL